MPYKYKAKATAWRRAWIKKRWAVLMHEFGGICARCRTAERLEFAHLHPTALRGAGRGKRTRYYDIRSNPGAYWLLCGACHLLFDRERKRRVFT